MLNSRKRRPLEGTEMEQKKQVSSRLYILAQCLYWASGCAVVSFAVVYLGEKGFSQSEAGMICSAAAALSFLLTSGMSALLDAGRIRSSALGGAFFGMTALSLMLAGLAPDPGFLTAAAYALSIAALQSAVFFYNKLYADLSFLGFRLDFGVARGLGSVSFSAASFLIGMLVRDRGSRFLPGAAAVLVLLQLLCVLVLSRLTGTGADAETRSNTSSGSLLRFLAQNRRFALFLFGAGLISAVNMTLTTFLIHITERAGGTPGTLGILNAYMALIEIPVMLFYSRLRDRVPLRSLAAVGLFCYCLKILGFTLSVNRVILFSAATLHALSFGLFTPASVDYVKDFVSRADSAKGQGLMVSAPILFSCVTLGVFGALLESAGLAATLWLFSGVSLLGLILCLFSV